MNPVKDSRYFICPMLLVILIAISVTSFSLTTKLKIFLHILLLIHLQNHWRVYSSPFDRHFATGGHVTFLVTY